MKTVTKIALLLIPTITLSLTAAAHDPKLHVKKAEKANCSKMDHSKMDMSDPVAIAMMKKCSKQAKADKKAMQGMDHSEMKKSEHKAEEKDADNQHDH